MIARDVMPDEFHTLSPGDTIVEAVRRFQTASDAEKKKVFGLMVTDENDHLVGILSMYDILMFIQPKHVHILGEMDDIDPSQLYDERLERVKSVLVGDIMTPEVVTIGPHTHLKEPAAMEPAVECAGLQCLESILQSQSRRQL